MIALEYAPSFLRQLEKFPRALQQETLEKVRLFKDKKNHRQLEVHKLKGKLKEKWSFSVNYSYRVVFKWLPNKSAGLLTVGDHDIYKYWANRLAPLTPQRMLRGCHRSILSPCRNSWIDFQVRSRVANI